MIRQQLRKFEETQNDYKLREQQLVSTMEQDRHDAEHLMKEKADRLNGKIDSLKQKNKKLKHQNEHLKEQLEQLQLKERESHHHVAAPNERFPAQQQIEQPTAWQPQQNSRFSPLKEMEKPPHQSPVNSNASPSHWFTPPAKEKPDWNSHPSAARLNNSRPPFFNPYHR